MCVNACERSANTCYRQAILEGEAVQMHRGAQHAGSDSVCEWVCVSVLMQHALSLASHRHAIDKAETLGEATRTLIDSPHHMNARPT